MLPEALLQLCLLFQGFPEQQPQQQWPRLGCPPWASRCCPAWGPTWAPTIPVARACAGMTACRSPHGTRPAGRWAPSGARSIQRWGRWAQALISQPCSPPAEQAGQGHPLPSGLESIASPLLLQGFNCPGSPRAATAVPGLICQEQGGENLGPVGCTTEPFAPAPPGRGGPGGST